MTGSVAWLQPLAEERHPVDIPEIDGHRAAGRLDVHFAEELQSTVRRQIRLPRWWHFGKHHLRSERAVQGVRAKRPGIKWTGDEFPEAIEIAEGCPRGVVIMCGAIVN